MTGDQLFLLAAVAAAVAVLAFLAVCLHHRLARQLRAIAGHLAHPASHTEPEQPSPEGEFGRAQWDAVDRSRFFGPPPPAPQPTEGRHQQ